MFCEGGTRRKSTYRLLILHKTLIVARDGDKKEKCSDVFKTMNPFLALTALATHIEHTICQSPEIEDSLGDTGGFQPSLEDVLVVRCVVGREKAREVGEIAIAVSVIGQLKLAPLHAMLPADIQVRDTT